MSERFLFTAHGFGVGRDSNGLFTDVAKVLPDHTPKMMSFYKRHEGGHPRDLDIIIHDEQAELLKTQINKVEGEKVLLAHSMGNVALMKTVLSGEVRVDRAVMLAPVLDNNHERIMNEISLFGGTANPHGTSFIPRGDGESHIFLPESYFSAIEKLDLPALYEQVTNKVPTVIVRALRDRFVRAETVENIRGARHIAIDADHNFSGEANRFQLQHKLAEALAE